MSFKEQKPSFIKIDSQKNQEKDRDRYVLSGDID